MLVGGTGPVTRAVRSRAACRSIRCATCAAPIHPVRDVLALREITAALRAFAPDLVSAHTAKAGWLGRAAAARLGLPVIYTPHGLPMEGRFTGAASLMFALAERAASRWSTRGDLRLRSREGGRAG